MDSDLVEAVSRLKAIFEKRKIPAVFGTAAKALLDDIKKRIRLPGRYRSFLLEANPVKVHTVTPVECIQLFSADDLVREQVGFSLDENLNPRSDDAWRKSWVVVGRSSLLGDPYFIDTAKLDAEGDCPVYTAMSGTERWDPTLAASSFVQFLQILALAMEVAEGFGNADVGVDDEDVFREALAPKIRPIDPAAFRVGYWT